MFIDQCMVTGENMDAPFALIVPNKDQLRIYCKHKKIDLKQIEDIANSSELDKKIKEKRKKPINISPTMRKSNILLFLKNHGQWRMAY